ncbi:hypothetical protein L9F63_000417 [Diploptera punctata]|uniref:Uncharacterized protein n=1 Tax=Diploptera punctata TaxID=6984 RepID=A0AAD8ESP4_DIPPU|nr:hypothetical protein L9F63_000417 [Diploptera punctata]
MANVLTVATFLVLSCLFCGFSTAENSRKDEEFNNTSTTEVRSKEILSTPSTQKYENENETIPEPSALLSDSSGYRMPGIFDFNGGEPFYLEKDPVTGAVNFSVKTATTHNEEEEENNMTGPSLKNHKISETQNSDDYYYDDDEPEDGIDRRDSNLYNSEYNSQNNLNPSKLYSSSFNGVHTNKEHNQKYTSTYNNKFPLISSSYANTKFQGTGSANKNHRPYVTSSTQSPSYYTIRPQPHFSTGIPFRGTVKYSSTLTTSSKPPRGNDITITEATIKFSSTTEDYVDYDIQNHTAQHNIQQDTDSFFITNKQPSVQTEIDEETDNYAEEIQNNQPTSVGLKEKPNVSVITPEYSDSLFSIKTTPGPIDYEDDYDSDDSSGFSLAALFGYGKPSSPKGGKRPQTDEKKQQEPVQDQIYQQNPIRDSNQQYGKPVQDQIYQQNPTRDSNHQHEKPVQDQIYQQNPMQDSNQQYIKPVQETINHQKPTQDKKQPELQDQEDSEKYELPSLSMLQTFPTSQSSYVTSVTSNLPSVTKDNSKYNEQNFISKSNQTSSQSQTTIRATTHILPITSTQAPGIIYSEADTVRPLNYETSLPLNVPVQSNYKPFPTQSPQIHNSPTFPAHSENYQPNITKITLNSAPKLPQTVNTNYKPNSNQQQVQYSNFFEVNTERNKPYGSYAEEPFRPIFGPGELDERPLLHRPEHQALVDSANKDKNSNGISSSGTVNIVSKPPIIENVNIPNESPSRWSYPHNDGTSTFFQLPPQEKQKQSTINPIVNSGNGRPRPQLQITSFIETPVNQNFKINSQQKPVLTFDTSAPVRNPIPNQTRIPANTNDNQNTPGALQFQDHTKTGQTKGDKGHVIFPDSISEEAKPQVDIVKRPTAALPERETNLNPKDRYNQLPSISQPDYQESGPNLHQSVTRLTNKNPAPIIHDMIKEPAQVLRPPAEPEEFKKSSTSLPHWESRPPFSHLPSSQTARPKHDPAPYKYVQSPQNSGSDFHTQAHFVPEAPLQANRPQPVSKNPNLPNILPHFRPNAKISHIHIENGGGVQAHTYFGNPRQPLLERPSRRPSSEIMGHLHPPPPPYRRRVNRNDTPGSQDIFPFEKIPPQPPAVIQQRPLVHRRTGPHVTDESDSQLQVATLQMMQQHQHQQQKSHYLSRPLAARDDFPHSQEELSPPVHLKYPSGSSLDTEASEKHPVFVVYPVNSSPVNIRNESPDNSGVVVGTRGPQRPVPPSNLDSDGGVSLSSDDIAPLPFLSHKNQKPILQRPSDRLDNISNGSTVKRPTAVDFPYPLEKPDTLIEDDKSEEEYVDETNQEKSSTFVDNTQVHRYDNEFSIVNEGLEAEVHNSKIEKPGSDNAEINIIPYLQDYVPVATKKPVQVTKLIPEKFSTINPTSLAAAKIDKNKPNLWNSPNNGYHNLEGRIIYSGSSGNELKSSTNSVIESNLSPSPISVVLKTVQPQTNTTNSPVSHSTSSTPFKITDYPKSSLSPSVNSLSQSSHQQGLVGSGGSEFTVSAVMHTHPQAINNHKPAEGASSTTSPPQLNFQAPFLASANIGGTPISQGWSVVGKGSHSNERMKPGAVERADISSEKSDNVSEDSSKTTNFDFENFKPQLFGGFKPIYTFPEENSEEQSKFLQTTERQEKML